LRQRWFGVGECACIELDHDWQHHSDLAVQRLLVELR
jgi:hypothetical protein